ncbi:MAG: TetR/AcrR family transcriptional regulator [Propionibacteriaceae bacterium]
MGTLTSDDTPVRRVTLSRDRVLHRAIAYADSHGIESLSMRSLAAELDVVPMALYKHVINKDDLLDGMIEVVVGEIARTPATGDWKSDVRARILAARQSLLRHRWARAVLESRAAMTPAMLGYLDSLTGLFLDGGLSVDLTHFVMHALGNRMWGFSQELFAATPRSDTASFNATKAALPAHHPHLAQIAMAAAHADTSSAVGPGCDAQFEFEFALDLVLDGVTVLHARDWTSVPRISATIEGSPRA